MSGTRISLAEPAVAGVSSSWYGEQLISDFSAQATAFHSGHVEPLSFRLGSSWI